MARLTLEGNRMSGMTMVSNKWFVLSQTLTATLTLTADMPNMLFLDPGGADRNVVLPAAANGAWFSIYNTADASEYLDVFLTGGTTLVARIAPGQSLTLVSNGSVWYGEDGEGGGAAQLLGTIAAQPVSGSFTARAIVAYPVVRFDFTFTAAQIPVTDAGASGASGSLKLWDLTQQGWLAQGGRQNYTAFAEGAALTTGAGDAVHVLGLGSVAANAGDGALTGTEVDWSGASTGQITNSGGTGTGTLTSAVNAAVDGTGTASDIYLNWSGTAATIDANSTIDVTGTASIVMIAVGDD